MFVVTKEFRFEAAHRLPHLPKGHKCRNLHGHSYRFTVTVHGYPDARGFVMDYAELARIVDPLVAALDHSYLAYDLGEDPIKDACYADGQKVYLLICHTTAENLASLIATYVQIQLPAEVKLAEVAVYETQTTVARWSPE